MIALVKNNSENKQIINEILSLKFLFSRYYAVKETCNRQIFNFQFFRKLFLTFLMCHSYLSIIHSYVIGK